MRSNLQEKILLLRLRKKDPEAFAKLYDLYLPAIYRFVFFKVPTKQDAEDITSEVFLRVWQYITDKDQKVENLKSLLYTTARNLVIDFYRTRSKATFVDDEEALLKIEDSRQQNILAQIDFKTEIKNIEVVIRSLKDEYKEIIILRFIEELSITEIAGIINKSKGAVRVLIHRALKIVKETIDKSSE